jgi:hypothetical protein
MGGIFCNNCGAKLDEAPTLLPDQRPPCPRCGSLARRITQTVRSNILPMPGLPRRPSNGSSAWMRSSAPRRSRRRQTSRRLPCRPSRPTASPSAAEAGNASVQRRGAAMGQVHTEGRSSGVRRPRRIIDHLVVQGRSLWWTQLTEEGGWLLQVVDEAGEEIATAANYDPVEALAAVADFILPGHPG